MGKSKSRDRKVRTERTTNTLSSLPRDYAGYANRYGLLTLRLKPQIEGIALGAETLPRRNQSKLGNTQKEQFIKAFETIIKNGQFADLVSIHSDAYRNRIHTERTDLETNPRFLPWHRVFLYELEFRLNSTPEGNSSIRIPYWDWTVDRVFPEWLTKFKPIVKDVPVFPAPPTPPVPVVRTITVERSIGKAINPRSGRPFELPTKDQTDSLKSYTDFIDFTAYLESLHGLPHIWVGGTMGTYVSPADPVFWLHHSNIDRLWSLWPRSQSERPDLKGRDAEMTPWSYRTDRDRIEDTRIFNYTYE